MNQRTWTDPAPILALHGGPKHGQWYWEADFAALQDATRAAATAYTPPIALAPLHYHPTGQQITRHIGRDRIATATVYTYQPEATTP